MSILEAIVLGIVQGLTEFLPVSSSGHLILTEKLFGMGTGTLAFDVALHAGTLLALVIFFWRDIVRLIRAAITDTDEARLTRLLAVATMPAIVVGALLEDFAKDTFRSTTLVAFNLIVIAIIMLIAERQYRRRQESTAFEKVQPKQAMLMGFAQALAIIPGISRSGSTITAGLLGGMDRVAATRFSFLLGIPITFGALLKTMTSSEGLSQIKDDTVVFLFGIGAALISGIVAITFLISFLSKHGLRLFAYYRIVLGIGILLAALLH